MSLSHVTYFSTAQPSCWLFSLFNWNIVITVLCICMQLCFTACPHQIAHFWSRTSSVSIITPFQCSNDLSFKKDHVLKTSKSNSLKSKYASRALCLCFHFCLAKRLPAVPGKNWPSVYFSRTATNPVWKYLYVRYGMK